MGVRCTRPQLHLGIKQEGGKARALSLAVPQSALKGCAMKTITLWLSCWLVCLAPSGFVSVGHLTQAAFAAEGGAAAPDAAQKPEAQATPWPRRFVFPRLTLSAPEGAPLGHLFPQREWNPKAHRFTVVAVLASWNASSVPLAAWMSDLQDTLSSRNVRVVGAFSNDSDASVVRFLIRERPRFETGLASLAFLKELGNPKVPTVWVLNTFGEIVARKELPNEIERKRLSDQLMRWTEF